MKGDTEGFMEKVDLDLGHDQVESKWQNVLSRSTGKFTEAGSPMSIREWEPRTVELV